MQVINVLTDIPADGATDRVRLPNNGCFWCELYAPAGNAGDVYIGGDGVTNAVGTDVGFPLSPGDTLILKEIQNTNEIYAATDNAGDDIGFLARVPS